MQQTSIKTAINSTIDLSQTVLELVSSVKIAKNGSQLWMVLNPTNAKPKLFDGMNTRRSNLMNRCSLPEVQV